MKIGVYSPNASPEIGGGYTFSDELLKALAKYGENAGHQFVLITRGGGTPVDIPPHIELLSLSRNKWKDEVSRIIAEFLRSLPLKKTCYLTKIEKVISDNKIDMLWYLSQGQYLTLEVPYITVVWDLQHRLQPYFPEVSNRGQWEYRERIYGNLLKRASKIITGTEAGKVEIENFYQIFGERIKILPHPTPSFALEAPETESALILRKYNIPPSFLFYPAQFWPHKNHAGLLYAIKLLRDNYNIVLPVVFVGSNKGNIEYITGLVSILGLQDQVHILGFVTNTDLVALYRQALALTYMTFFGPENLPPLEAFALGCPVIASNVSGAQEQLGDAAILVDPTNENQIAEAIKSIFENQILRDKLIERGKTRALKFTGKDFVTGIFSIINEMAPILRCWGKTLR